MDYSAVLGHIERLRASIRAASGNIASLRGVRAQIVEFMGQVVPSKSSFVQMASNVGGTSGHIAEVLESALDSLKAHIEAGLLAEVSPTRRAQLDVVSDFLQQAQQLLGAKGVHPAAPIVLIGATLEEFLRTWIEDSGLHLGQRKPSIDAFAQILFGVNLITKQDMKDLTAWAGLRNLASHGEWAEVSDRQRAQIMLEGVNLFMRRYGVQ